MDTAINTLLSVGFVSHVWMLCRQSSIELDAKPDAVTPCASSRQPSTLMQSDTLEAMSFMYRSVWLEASARRAPEVSGSLSGASRQAIPESASEEGTGSRLPRLPRAIQQNSAGGRPPPPLRR